MICAIGTENAKTWCAKWMRADALRATYSREVVLPSIEALDREKIVVPLKQHSGRPSKCPRKEPKQICPVPSKVMPTAE